ncbi:MAG TPA: ABC transporter ATP-binding protein [Caulobacteraceae bacterium]|jgi:ABC-type multidrug transport system ATPase subunit
MSVPSPAADDASQTPTLLSVRGVAKRFGRVQAVADVTFALGEGEIVGFVGPNGAGKTTTMRIIAGLLRADAGAGEILGMDLYADRHAIGRLVGYMPQKLALYADLSVADNLRFRADIYGLSNARGAVEDSIETFGLGDYRRQHAGRLSGGWARRLQLAATLIHKPRLVLLDEPTAGLDAESRHDVWLRIARLARRGASVIINTHDLGEAEQCTRVALFAEGRILAEGAPDALSRALPMEAMRLDGPAAHELAEQACAIEGVLAAYPEGRRLRVLAKPGSEAAVRAMAEAAGVKAEPVERRFEDTAYVAVQRRSEPLHGIAS